jgi:hypothetical protein
MKRKKYFAFLVEFFVFESIQKTKIYLAMMLDVSKEADKKVLITINILKE